MLLGIAGFSAAVGIFTEMEMAKLTSSHQSVENVIISLLRQIGAAKSEFALEKKVSPDYVPTEADLLPYIKPDKEGKLPHVGPERYVLNAIGKEPYAILDKGWRILNRSMGDWSRYAITNGTTYRLP